MPGIVGIISREPAGDCRRQLAAMVRSMRHEPYYQSGTCEAQEIGVYAGWVAHPGSLAASESRSGESGATDLVFAGECARESGVSLLQVYERLGENWVVELNGLFSGLLIDRRRGRASVFNDRYAVERLYVHQAGEATYFASEAKALLCVLPATRSFDDQGVAQFLTFGCPIEGRTLFRDIRLLEGGSVWTFDGASCKKKQYFTAAEWECQPALSAEDFQSEFQLKFKSVLPRYVASESRIGISLTGGLDTRMIMACLPALSTPPVCYTYAGVQGHTLDARISARVASECGFEHRVLRIGADFLSGYSRYVDRTVYATDGSAGALGSHEIYLSEQARLLASVRLTGNFGSEVLRSMSTFKRMTLSRELIAGDVFVQAEGVSDEDAASHGRSAVTFAAFREIPWNLFGLMASAKSQLTFRTPYLDNDILALTYRAPASVRQSAASALRLVHDAHPRLGTIPTDRAVVAGGRGLGYALRRFVAELTFKLDYMHKEAPPPGLMGLLGALDRGAMLGRHKWLPYRLWFRKELAKYVVDTVSDPTTLRLPFWNQRFLPRMVHDHVNGTRNYVREINATLTLAAVDRLLVRGQGWS
jgi:asparagine synthase (glutamine-hydrolysing)